MADQPQKPINQGPEPAFPLYAMIPTGKKDFMTGGQEVTAVIQPGMTLRDYFAGVYLMTYVAKECYQMADEGGANDPLWQIAKECYQMADKMIEERKNWMSK